MRAYFFIQKLVVPMRLDPTDEDIDIVFVNHERCGKCAKMRNEFKNYGIKSLLDNHSPELVRVPAGAMPPFEDAETLAAGRDEIRQFVEEHIA